MLMYPKKVFFTSQTVTEGHPVCVDCVGELELTRIEKRIEVVLKC